MSYGKYIVEEHDGKHVMVEPLVCDGCGRRERLKVIEIATCMTGDEVDGCNQLAMKVEHEGWLHRIRDQLSDYKEEHYCSDCAAPYIHKGETWTINGVDVVGTGEL